MTRKCFYSFHYAEDNWRVATVKNIGSVEGQPIVSGNEFEQIKAKGDDAVKNWINGNMAGRSTLIILIGANTAGRKWVDYEIEYAWSQKKAILGINIHKLLDRNGNSTSKGANPFANWTVGTQKTPMSNYAKVYDPAGADSKSVYASISNGIEGWIEEAIRLRG